MDYELDKRERILNAAAELILKTGLQTPMSAIAEAARVATGSLYNYFPSKDELVFAVYERVAAGINELVVPIDWSISHRERVEAYARAYIEHIWANNTRAMLYEVITNSPMIMQKKVGSLFLPFVTYSVEVLSDAHPEREEGMSAQLRGSFVRGAIRNTLKRHRATGAEMSEQLKMRIVDMCWAAITA